MSLKNVLKLLDKPLYAASKIQKARLTLLEKYIIIATKRE